MADVTRAHDMSNARSERERQVVTLCDVAIAGRESVSSVSSK